MVANVELGKVKHGEERRREKAKRRGEGNMELRKDRE